MKCETSDGIALLKADTFKDKQQLWRDPPMKNTLKTTMLLATMGALITVSYTHLTLPTKA